MRIGRFTEKDMKFPSDPAVMREIHKFSVDPNTKCVTFTHVGMGINPAIDAKLKELGATEFICNYSNRVTPSTSLTVLYR